MIASEVPNLNQEHLVKELQGAFFEAGIELENQGQPSESQITDTPDLSGISGVDICEPNLRETVSIDRESRWEAFENDRYEAWKARDRLEIWGDQPGLGKTTNVSHGAASRGDAHVLYLPKHENCREFETDSNKPSIDLHLKGPKQPRADSCMDAKVEGKQCQDHKEGCPTMCPIFSELSRSNPLKQRFETLSSERGPQEAHRVLDLGGEPWHESQCDWQKQWDDLDNANRIVTVHNYLTVEPVTLTGLNIIDDIQTLLEEDQELTASQLGAVAETLQSFRDDVAIPDLIGETSRFVEDLIELLDPERGDDDQPELSTLDPPSFEVESCSWVTRRLTDEIDPTAEALAWVKHAYREMLLYDVVERDGILQATINLEAWDHTPLALDVIFVAAMEAGLSEKSVRRTIDRYPGVEQCPNCGEVSTFGISSGFQIGEGDDYFTENPEEGWAGYHKCEKCGWDEHNDPLTADVGELPRAIAWIDEDRNSDSQGPPKYNLNYRLLPLASDLPDPETTLILDATPTIEKYALLFGLAVDDVVITGDEPGDLNAHITQIVNGQYHRSTIARSEKGGQSLRKRINKVIRLIEDKHNTTLVVGHRRNEDLYELGESEWMYFYAGRGLDRPDSDAVVIVGAPHPNEADLKRDARLLTMDQDAICLGGEEHSLRRNEEGELAANPPITQSYFYEDGNGKGRSADTKGYTGLVGELFQDAREKELVQLAHRVRPIIADQTKYIYLLTNVPTDLPIDTLATMDEFVQPISGQIDIPEGAITLLDQCCEIMDEDRDRFKDNWFREWNELSFGNTASEFHALSEEVDTMPNRSERTIRSWLNQLDEAGLMERSDEYSQGVGEIFQADFPALKQALLILSNNGYFNVDETRRLVRELKTADNIQEWVGWVKETFEFPFPDDRVTPQSDK